MIAQRAREREDELRKLCKDFKVDYGSGDMTDKLLFRQLLHQDPDAIYTYKRSSNIERTLIKTHLKPRMASSNVAIAKSIIRKK